MYIQNISSSKVFHQIAQWNAAQKENIKALSEKVHKAAGVAFNYLKSGYDKWLSISFKTLPLQLIAIAMYPIYGGVVLGAVAVNAMATIGVKIVEGTHYIYKKYVMKVPEAAVNKGVAAPAEPAAGNVITTLGAKIADLYTKYIVKAPEVAVNKGVVAPAKPAEPEDPKFSGPSILSGKVFSPGAQFYEKPQEIKIPMFTVLTLQEVRDVIALEPSLKSHKVAQNAMVAAQSIEQIHQSGIGGLDPEIKDKMQFEIRYILFRIKEEKILSKQQEMLKDLATCLEDCAIVSADCVHKMCQSLLSSKVKFDKTCKQSQFEVEMQGVMRTVKEKAIEEVVYELFPQMTKPGYAQAHHGQPQMQFPHVINGFVSVYGGLVGLDTTIISKDKNRNETLALKYQGEFLDKFNKKLNFNDVIKNFIIEVNTVNNTTLHNEDFYIWCGQHVDELGAEAAYFNEDVVYPKYFPKPIKSQKDDLTAAYINEEAAIKVFQILKYIN
jgi:hypothetical protein